MSKTFTIEEIRNYLVKQDSMGDMLYYLSESNIEAANAPSNDDEFDDYNHESDDDDDMFNGIINGHECHEG